ncbi:MAG: PKD domain-containing protein [Thermoanaerobaculia bacterium]
MRVEARKHLWGTTLALVVGAALLLGSGTAQAAIKYLGDGGVQNSRGGWDLPKQGTCPADPTAKTRPDCVARRFKAADSAACTALGTSGWYSWSTGVCNDLANATEAACKAVTDRYWNAATSTCAIVMEDDDRNAVVCAKHGGTWVTTGQCTGGWVMPARDDAAYGSGGLLTGNGPGDQCLRCHNSVTQYNGPRVRDTDFALTQGHKNMSRPVSPTFKPWGGPPFHCTGKATATTEEACVAAGGTWDPEIYPSDDTGNTFDWTKNQITVGANKYDLKWIYGDWLSALPRAIYTGPTLNNMSYSCGRCHTTGWTSDAGSTPNAKKHPELDFPGITWTGTADAATGKVKTGGGVAGDANVMSSWDQWGISCTRCHNSAIDDSGAGPTYSAPAGMSSHHNQLTTAQNNSGACTDARWASAPSGSTLDAKCTSAGGTFLTACSVNPTPGVCTMAATTKDKCTAASGTWVDAAAWCSNAFYTDQASCEANKYVWQAGWCKTADAQSACTGGSGDGAKTFRANGSQASCQVAGAAWTYAKCTVEGFCNKGTCTNAKYTNEVECSAAGAFWYAVRSKAVCDALGGQFAYATDVIGCDDAGGRWISNYPNRGQVITSVCMDCHRQETSGLPNTNGTCSDATKTTQGACVAAGGTWTESGNGLPLTVGPYHSTVTFPSHPHSNQFLNSPHGQFTGKWSEIATGKYTGTSAGKYASAFMTWGEAYNSGNGCTGCHDVHQSTVDGEKPFSEECNVCHHVKSLEHVAHPSGPGTPLAMAEEDRMEACVTCHMPGGLHLFRINTDANYSTFPMPQAMAANTAANTAPDGSYTNAVWVDIDAACGQCHGGGTANVATTGSISAASANLTVASATGFVVGQKVRVAGAGGVYYDEVGQSPKYADFDTYVKSIAGNVITLAGTATKGVTNAAVTQNVTTNGASYQTKATLAALAKGMHNDVPSAVFTAAQGANELTVSVDASKSKCRGSLDNCSSLSWNWGDGSATGSGKTATHAYMAAGSYTVTLTVEDEETGTGTATQTFAAKAIPGAPTVTASCTYDYPNWSATCTVTVPTGGYASAGVYFGDGTDTSKVANPAAGPLAISHTYAYPGNYTIKATVTNAAGLSATAVIGDTARGSFAVKK